MSTSSHVVVVLETTDHLPMSLAGADATCEELCGVYKRDYPEGLKVTGRFGDSRAVFTVTGYWGHVHNQLQKLGASGYPGPTSTVTINQRVFTVKSCTIVPEPPSIPQTRNATAAPVDDGYNQMIDLAFKMATLMMQGLDS